MHSYYLLDTIVLLSAAVVIVPIFQYLKLGAIPGYLCAGILLGPSIFGYFENIEDFKHLAEFGVVLLLFVIGMELKPLRIWNMRLQVLGLGSTQLFITAFFLTIVFHLLFDINWEVSLLIGLSLSLSSTAFVLQLLSDRNTLSAIHGRAALAILLFQDLAVVPLLALVSVMSRPETFLLYDIGLALAEAAAILFLVIVIARFILNPILSLLAKMASTDIFTATALLLVLGFAGLFDHLGLSLAMGAFVGGLLISDSSFRHQILAEVEPFRTLLLGLFFMTMGMALNLRLFLEAPFIILTSLLIMLGSKTGVLFLLAKIFHIDSLHAKALALLLSQAGEFALVIFAMAFAEGLIDFQLFQQLLIIVLVSMLITPLLDNTANALLKKNKTNNGTTASVTESPLPDPILIAGFGRMGKRIGEILEKMHVAYVAIDSDITVVNSEQKNGKPVYFGDVTNAELLRKAGAAKAPLAIVAIDHLEAVEKVVASLHEELPDLPIFARAHNRKRCRELQELGATFTISETFQASAEIAREALIMVGKDEWFIDRALNEFQEKYYKKVSIKKTFKETKKTKRRILGQNQS